MMLRHGHYMFSDTSTFDLLPMVKDDCIRLIAASPRGMGLSTDRGVSDWYPATKKDKAIVKKAAAFCKENVTTIEKIALQPGCANTNIPTNLESASKPKRIVDNINIVEEEINMELSKEVQKILTSIKNKDYDFAGNCEQIQF